jgi:hypothetical protein
MGRANLRHIVAMRGHQGPPGGPICRKGGLPPGSPGGSSRIRSGRGLSRSRRCAARSAWCLCFCDIASRPPKIGTRRNAPAVRSERTGSAIRVSDPGEHVTDGRHEPLAVASRRDASVIENACNGPRRGSAARRAAAASTRASAAPPGAPLLEKGPTPGRPAARNGPTSPVPRGAHRAARRQPRRSLKRQILFPPIRRVAGQPERRRDVA